MVEVVTGLGLLPDVIIDQHFSQRGRMGRLLPASAENPGLVGMRFDENTAVFVQRNGILETLGDGMVTLINGRNTVSNYFDRKPGDVLTIINLSLLFSVLGRNLTSSHTCQSAPSRELSRHADVSRASIVDMGTG
jgi:cyanophycinase